MKKYFALLILNLFLFQGVFAQTTKAEIDKKRQEIKNNISIFQKIDSVSDSTGYSYAYAKNNKIQFTKVYHKDGNIDKNVEWYFSNGKEIYAEQIWTDRTSGKITDNEKIYLVDSKLIALVRTNGIAIDTTTTEFKKEAIAAADNAQKMENYYSNKLNGASK